MRPEDTTQAGASVASDDGSHLPLSATPSASGDASVGDLDAYLAYLAHLDMPIGVKIDLIAALHAIMQSFVDRAFGDDPVQQVRRADRMPDAEDAGDDSAVIDLAPTIQTETDENELTGAFRTPADRDGGRK